MKPAPPCPSLCRFLLYSSLLVLLCSCTAAVKNTGSNGSSDRMALEDMGNGICRQGPSRLMWQIKKSKKFSTWEEANEYAGSLELGGYDDWRLPTREETLFLSELLQLNKGGCPITFKRPHWVNTREKATAGYWEDYPLCGGSELLWVEGKHGPVRAVRP